MSKLTGSSLSLAALLAFASVAAHAGSYDANTHPCVTGSNTVGYTLNAVETAITTAHFTNLRDQTNLLSKLAAANSKTLESKWSDASVKLKPLKHRHDAGERDKPKLDSADGINSAVLAAQACIAFPA